MTRRSVLLLLLAPCLLPAQPLVFHRINVVDVRAGRILPDRTVVIRGPRIVQVAPSSRLSPPRDARVVEGAGKYLIPGLADLHNHLGVGNPAGPPVDVVTFLAGLLPWGVTTVFSPGIPLEDDRRARAAAAGEQPGLPRFFGVGPALTAPGGHMARMEHHGVEIPATAEAARALVRELEAASVDAIKVIVDSMEFGGRPALPAMQPGIVAAIIDEAHRRRLKVYAHAVTLAYAKAFLRAGGDGLLHGIVDQPVDAEFLALMKTGGRFYISTLTLMEAIHDIAGFARRQAQFDRMHRHPAAVYATLQDPAFVAQANARFRGTIPDAALQILRDNLLRVARAGIPVATGTDTAVPGVVPGVASQLELVLSVEAGLTPAQALRAATLTAQQILGRDRDLGEIVPGKLADLVVLDADPLAAIPAIAAIHAVVKSGTLHAAEKN